MRDPDIRGKGGKQFQTPIIMGENSYDKQRKDAHLVVQRHAEKALLGNLVESGRSTLKD